MKERWGREKESCLLKEEAGFQRRLLFEVFFAVLPHSLKLFCLSCKAEHKILMLAPVLCFFSAAALVIKNLLCLLLVGIRGHL